MCALGLPVKEASFRSSICKFRGYDVLSVECILCENIVIKIGTKTDAEKNRVGLYSEC